MGVPYLSEDSIVAWDDETTRGTAPSASTWRDFGRVEEFRDLGPTNALRRDYIAGGGRQAFSIERTGIEYGGSLSFQVVDPLVLGYFWGEETARTQIGTSGFYRHTVNETTNGQLPSMSVQMRDQQGSAASSPTTDKFTYLEVVMNELGITFERINDDGSGGRVQAEATLMPHDHDRTVEDKSVTPDSSEPYSYSEGKLTLFGETSFPLLEGEIQTSNNAEYRRWWEDSPTQTPNAAPPQNVEGTFRFTLEGQGTTFSGLNNEVIRAANANGRSGDATLRFARTVDEDEWQIDLTSITLQDAQGRRTSGPVEIECVGWIQDSQFQYVDGNNTAFFPT